ncbi:hypothetical protein FVEG_17368 [Fusarium verticillioides 7600]|uniref:Uncharacterized protein n=1 Tax=Gibberella moniliformis (strain M3125 / FGSC 7600) TaxID=334819 RepID=W7N385_GIBM7|nr:hypothetical protein FVEG_17368 [Fusarium verticillioides 7600]EWG54695.1 hypothetical protein FVEG_17368 [Fusarium verticillioides 7600]
MVRFFSSKKAVDSKGQACEAVPKEVEESVRALEDFEIELDYIADDYVEIIDHAAPKRPRAVWKDTKEVDNQGFIIVMKDTEVKAIMKHTKGKAKLTENSNEPTLRFAINHTAAYYNVVIIPSRVAYNALVQAVPRMTPNRQCTQQERFHQQPFK